MADMRKIEEGSAFPEKRKLDLPNSINKTLEEKEEVEKNDKSESNKKQKLDTPTENEKNITSYYIVSDEMAESKDGKENYRAEAKDVEDELSKVDVEIVDDGKETKMVDKGKGILIEESSSEDDDDDDDDSSDDSDSDFYDGLDSDSEDDLRSA